MFSVLYLRRKIAQLGASDAVSCFMWSVHKSPFFLVSKNVHLSEENAINIYNNFSFFSQAKKRVKVFGNKLTYMVILYKTPIVLYILISNSTSFHL